MKIELKDRTLDNLLYQRLKRVHYTMVRRCTVPGSTGYDNYGAKGVTVCEKWLDFEGFLDDVDKIPGFDEDRYVSDKLSLDKDREWGNKLYSLETCRFLTPEENNTIKPNQQYQIVGYSPEKVTYHFHSANAFAKEHNLNYTSIIKCAKNETGQIHHKGWQFCLLDNYKEGVFLEPWSWERFIIGMSPEGKTYRFYNASEFSREHPEIIESTVIYACLKYKINHTARWQFRWEDELDRKPFLPVSELKNSTKRGIKIVAVSPEGKEYITDNRTKFSEEHNINRRALANILEGKRDNYKGWKFRYY